MVDTHTWEKERGREKGEGERGSGEKSPFTLYPLPLPHLWICITILVNWYEVANPELQAC